jgi:hypothetical protein
VALADGLAEFLDAGHGGVAGEVGVQGGDGGAFDVIGRGKVGFAHAKVHDIEAGAAEAFGFGGNLGGGGDADQRDPGRRGWRSLHDTAIIFFLDCR